MTPTINEDTPTPVVVPIMGDKHNACTKGKTSGKPHMRTKMTAHYQLLEIPQELSSQRKQIGSQVGPKGLPAKSGHDE